MLEQVVYYHITTKLQYLCRNRLCITTSLQNYNTYAGIGCVLPHHYKITIPMPEQVVYYRITTKLQYLCRNRLCITASLQNFQYLCQNRLCITASLQNYNTYAGIGCVLLHHYKITIPMLEQVVYYHLTTKLQYLCRNRLCITTS